MQNFQDTFETCKQSAISVFSICMTVPLINVKLKKCEKLLSVLRKIRKNAFSIDHSYVKLLH